MAHLFYLDGLRKVGARFEINDLSKEEWDGLMLIENIRGEVESELIEKEREKLKLQAATRKAAARTR